MKRRLHLQYGVLVLVAGLAVAPAVAQCVAEDFESDALLTPVTTQVEGVTIRVAGQTCHGSPKLYMRVADSFYGDNFGSQVLVIDTGCPDFSDDYLEMIFEQDQGEVRFLLGPWATTYSVRVYDAPTGGTLIQTQKIVIPGSGFAGVQHAVRVARAARDIRRIEVEANSSGHEAIDHLTFGQDTTPPEVTIASPDPLECVYGEVVVSGTVCDPDGAYDRDRLEYRRVWPSPQTDWTLVREFVNSPVCSTSSLYNWDTADTAVADGIYLLRVTSINACGLATSEEVIVQVNNTFDSVALRSPSPHSIIGGTVCFDGTAWERTCFDHYVVEYRPASGGTWQPVDPAHPTYTSMVTNDPLASWSTGGLPDDDYVVALGGFTSGGASKSHQVAITLDNTPPVAKISAPDTCSNVEGVVEIEGTAYDEHLHAWRLQLFNPLTQAWTLLADGTSNVSGDLLGVWDTAGLAPCIYLLRLRVTDAALIDACIDPRPNVTDCYLPVAVGLGGVADLDYDGDVDMHDFKIFMTLFTGPLP